LASLVRGSTSVYIVTSHSAADALPTLESASRHTYDAALVRSIAADDECFRVLEALAELHPHVPSLCLIDGDGDEERRAYVAGAWSVMHVPAEQEVVLRWLDRAFATSRMRRRVVRQNEALDQYAQRLEQTKPAEGSRDEFSS
jgi:DNA-binding NarL/FixJ family response regulator